MAAPTTKRTARIVGKQIKLLRGKTGLSCPALAAKLGIDRTHLWRIEEGQTLPSFALLDRIARFFDVGIDALRTPARDA